MPDTRINHCMAEVSAAMELLANARTTLHDLLDEDPAFPLSVQASLVLARRELFRCDISALEGMKSLRKADAIENRGVA